MVFRAHACGVFPCPDPIPMTTKNRREFLRLAAGSLGAATAIGMLPPGIRKALALPANNVTGTINDVEHIVILMQENRSFDHYFGSLRGVRGFGDPRPIQLPGGDPVWHQPNGTGYVLPFRPQTDDLGLAFVQDLVHDWQTTHHAWNNGNYNQWVPQKGEATMAYFTREDIPFHYALADAFTICDAYHCSLLGPTDPNRYYMWTGWVGNDGTGGGPVIDNAEAGYDWSTYPERLQAAGVSWRIYQDAGEGLDAAGFWGWTGDNPYIGNYGDNSLLYFHQYQNAQPGDPLYQGARIGTNALGGESFFTQLQADVSNGTLPQVSWIAAPEAYSEHGNWPANYGAWYVSQVLDILTSNADLWSKTVFIVTYDENDGFFDHVPPPYAPANANIGLSTVDIANEIYAGDADNDAGPYGLGVRVPMIIVSPWSKGGWVCSQTFDHTSIIQFIEQRFGSQYPGLSETNITAWRRAICGDLTAAFNFATPDAAPPTMPSTAGYVPPDSDRHDDFDAVPPFEQTLPNQEPGLRPARALPYAFSVSGRIEADAGRYWLDFDNTGLAGAGFQIYSSNRSDGPWSYTLGAATNVSDHWTGSEYALSAYGPNGFLRTFSGNLDIATASGGANPEVQATFDASSSTLILQLQNSGRGDCVLTLAPNFYSDAPAQTQALAAGQSVTVEWPLAASSNWYDLSITSDSDPSYLRRLAGHMEDGNPSTSDPAIGAGSGGGSDRIFDNGFE
jgi:phospholipase C